MTPDNSQARATRLCCHGLLVMALALCLTGPAVAQRATVGGAKAAFLYNFARFTEWPETAFSTSSSPFVIGVAGDEGLRAAVDTVVKSKAVDGRALKTRNVKNAKDLADVQMLFVGGASGPRVADLLHALSGQPVLTVGDVDRFCDQGGMIAFLLDGNHMRFEIRFEATKQAGLKVSSRVLSLAKAIHGKS